MFALSFLFNTYIVKINMPASSLTQEVKMHAMLMALTTNHSDSVIGSF